MTSGPSSGGNSGGSSARPLPLTLTIDASLYEEALSFTDPHLDPPALVKEALQTFIRVKVGQRLSALHGVAPHMPSIPRRS